MTRWQDEPFGESEDDWNIDGSGNIGVMKFANAVQVWAVFQDRRISVAEAARAFNCAPWKIVEAVDHHPWMDAVGPTDDFDKMTIEHEGE